MQRHSSDNDGISSNDPSSSSSSHLQKRQGGSDEDSASSATPYSPDDLNGSLASLFEGLRGGISGEVGGNKEVQDALDTVMQMSVRKAQVKEDILADLETKKERLRSIGEEVRDSASPSLHMMPCTCPQPICPLSSFPIQTVDRGVWEGDRARQGTC